MTNKLNGSTDLLAKAMRQVFSEAVKPLEDKIDGVKTDLKAEIGDAEERLGNRIDRAVEDIISEKAPVK